MPAGSEGAETGLERLRRKLGRPGQGPLLGTWVMFVRTPGIVRMAARAGLDLVVLDLQHSAFGWETLADMCEVARASGIAALVRPTVLEAGTINRIQDLGAAGIVVPGVEDVATLERCVEWMHYPPHGRRGVSVGGPGTDYRGASLGAEPMAEADARQVVVVQIESRAGLDALAAVARSGLADMVELGRNDLAASLGVPGRLQDPAVEGALDRLLEAGADSGVAVGSTAGTLAEGAGLVRRGVSCVMWRTDKAILLSSYHEFATALADAATATGGPARSDDAESPPKP